MRDIVFGGNALELISVIVPIYNMEKYLEACLDSILSQTYENIEIILVDDGSTDKSAEICRKYAEIDKRIRTLNKKNGGVSAARNDGMRLSKGDWLSFVDSDDYIAPNYIERLYETAKDKAEISACCCVVCCDDRKFDEHFFPESKLYTDDKKALYLQMIREDYCRKDKKVFYASIGIAWGKLYKKVMLERALLSFDTELTQMEDTIFNLKALYHSQNVVYFDEALYYYRQSHRMEIKAAGYFKEFDAIYGKVSEKMLDVLKETALFEYENIREAFYLESVFRIADTLKKCSLNIAKKATFKKKVDSVRELAQRRANSLVIKNAAISVFKSLKIKVLLFLLKRKMYSHIVFIYSILQRFSRER